MAEIILYYLNMKSSSGLKIPAGMYGSNNGIENHHNGINKIAFHLAFHVVQRKILIFTVCIYSESPYPYINDVFVYLCAFYVYICVYVCVRMCVWKELL